MWAHELRRFEKDREGYGKQMASVSRVGIRAGIACAQSVRGQPGVSYLKYHTTSSI